MVLVLQEQIKELMKISKKNLEKFSKQIILKKIGIVGQKRIFMSKVLIIGAGGLGCPLALYLANSGVRNIGIADYDKIELSNLNRQIIYKPKDIGKLKANIIKREIKNIDKNIKVTIYKNKISKNNVNNIIKKFDIICDGTDNYQTRYLINDACLKYKKKLISAAIGKFDGQIFSFDFKNKVPCFRCFMPEIPNENNNCQTDGVLSTLAGMAGTIQANEVIKSILKVQNKLASKVLVFNALTLDFRKIKLIKNNNCIRECTKR